MTFTWPMLLSCKWFVYICNIHKWWNRTLGHSNASWHCDVDSSGLNAVPYGWHISYINSNKLFINNIVESRKHWKSFLLIKYSTISSLKVLVRLNGSIKWKSYDTFINKINKNSGGGGQKVGCILGRSSVHRRQNTHLRVHVRLISKPAKHVFGLRKETPAATRRTCKLYTERPHPTGRFTRGQTRWQR